MELEEPRVDVVCPTWCGKRWVVEAIDSVLAQTWRGLALTVVDDASPDGTLDAVRDRYGHDSRVELVQIPARSGAAAARMEAVRRTDAPLLAFIDQDDRWRPEKLELQIARLRTDSEVHVVHTDIEHIDAAGARMPGAADPDNARRARIDWEGLSRDELLETCFRAVSIRLVSALVRRDAFVAAGGFDTRHFGAEEWELWVRLAAAGCRMAHVPLRLVERRMHGANTSLVEVERRREGWFASVDEVVARHGELAPLADDLRASILRTEGLMKLRSGRARRTRDPLRRLAALRPRSLEVTGLRVLARSGPLAPRLLGWAARARRRNCREA
jgi:glycosyltransferase involved in cell wall biosynthesis